MKTPNLRPHCGMCKLEGNMQYKTAGGKSSAYCKECDIYGHTEIKEDAKLYGIASCFEMIHSQCTKGLFGSITYITVF